MRDQTFISADPSSGHPVFHDPGGWIETLPPGVDLTPPPRENLDGIVEATPFGPQLVAGDNVVDGVAHHAVITADPSEPDICGGCGREWPCGDSKRLLSVQMQRHVDPEALIEQTHRAAEQARTHNR